MPGWLQVFVVAALSAVVALQLANMLLLTRAPEDAGDRAVEAELLNLCRALSEVFSGWPDAFGVLDEIVAQFKTNTGHSMRDLLDRLDRAATSASTAAETAATVMSRLLTVTTLNAATGLRIEEHAVGVADDLAASHVRADATGGLVPGEAADAAAQSPAPPTSSSTASNGETNERS